MKLQTFSAPGDLLETVDVLCIPGSREKAEALYLDIFSQLIHQEALPVQKDFVGMKASPAFFYGLHGQRRIKIMYWSEADKLTESNAYSLLKKMAIRSRNDCHGITGVWLAHLPESGVISAAVAGWTAGQYDLGLYKQQDQAKAGASDLYAILPSGVNEQVARNGMMLGLAQQEVMNLVNTPASHKSPSYLGAWAARSAAQFGYETKVLDKQDLTTLGMHALLAVNRGSEQPAVCVVSHYKHPEARKKVVLVGKGVIFDTGGVSLKDSKNMHYMKSDMAGAAAVLGTVEACARLKLKVDVMAIAPATDNSIDGLSIKPGDVISSYAGKTIEVLDTDAEGRLILADALAYAVKEYKPDVVIDLATLTGSIVAALGPQAAGLFTKNNDLAASLEQAGTTTGERVWRMPMFDEYHDDMQSDIADIKNLSEKAYAGSITAAKFLEVFTDEHPAWAHLDIAGMGFQPNGFGKGYCATGYGVRLLVQWLSL